MAGIKAGLLLAGGYLGAQAVSGGLTALVSKSDNGTQRTREEFQRLPTPPYAPPPATYGIVWSGLAVTSSASAWRVWRAGQRDAQLRPQAHRALRWWAAALAARTAYTPLAFGRRALWPAAADSLLLTALMGRYAVLARGVDPAAGALAVPEVVWCGFASVLSADIARREQAR